MAEKKKDRIDISDYILEIKGSEINTIIKLAELCWSCRDMNGYSIDAAQKRDDGKCGICDGSGLKLTNNGENILNLVKRFHE